MALVHDQNISAHVIKALNKLIYYKLLLMLKYSSYWLKNAFET